MILRKPRSCYDFERTLLVLTVAPIKASRAGRLKRWRALYWIRRCFQRPMDAANGALRGCGLDEVRL